MKPRFISPTQAKNPREAAYLAALAADREQAFISDALSDWADAKQPSSSEMGLATLIANVACREANGLDYAINVLAEGGEEGGKEEKGKNKGKRGKSVRLKGRQRVVLRTALAQYKYCTRTPLYAIVDHAVEFAKHYGGGPSFGSFTNALLRRLPPDPTTDGNDEAHQQQQQRQQRYLTFTAEEGDQSDTRPLPLPKGDSEKALAIRLSYPPFLVHLLTEEFGKAKAKLIMEAGNTFPPTMLRSRTADAAAPAMQSAGATTEEEEDENAAAAAATAAAAPVAGLASKPLKHFWTTVKSLPPALQAPLPLPYTLGVVRSEKLLRQLTQDEGWYVTNGTPAALLARLAQGAVARVLGGTTAGKGKREGGLRVIDVCAAPGGKGLAVWDVIREGQGHRALALVMNDVNEEKTGRIMENLSKFGLEDDIHLTIGDGLTLTRDEVARQTGASLVEEGGKEERGFDVVILDAPCSNAGVLGRRPEARWRLRDDALLKELEETQFLLLKHASEELLSRSNPRGEIWYMTCSILRGEDEGMVERACRELGLEVVIERGKDLMMKVLPGEGQGGAFDGGFGCALRRKR